MVLSAVAALKRIAKIVTEQERIFYRRRHRARFPGIACRFDFKYCSYRVLKFPKGSNLEHFEVIANFFDNENYYIHGLNPKVPEQCIVQAKGEILMLEADYRVGGVNSPIEVGITFWYRHLVRFWGRKSKPELSTFLNGFCVLKNVLFCFRVLDFFHQGF